MIALDAYGGDQEDEAAKVTWLLLFFEQQRMRRTNFEQQWEEGAALAWPEYMSSFYFGRDIMPGQKRTQYQVDSSLSVASHRFGAIVDWLLTPSNMMWSKIECDDLSLMRQRPVAQWFADVTRIVWNERYKAQANFVGQNQQNMQGLGVFGNMGMLTDEIADYINPRERGIRYLGCPVGEWYVLTDHQRRVIGGTRHFRLTAQQAKSRWPKREMPQIEASLKIGSQQLYDFLHFIQPNTNYHPKYLLNPRKRWRFESTYICWQERCILEEGGYRTMPLAYGRYMQAPDEDYGRGPMQMVLATAKTLNAEKRDFLTQGHRAGDPAYFVGDPGLLDPKFHNGAINAGGFSPDGRFLVQALPAGNIQTTKEMMDDDRTVINDAFLVNLFQMILGDKKNEMSARQVVEYVNERGIILWPTVGRQCAEYLGYIINRELDILSRLRKLPPMPPALQEAGFEAKIVYSNPISRAVQSQESAGYVRTMEFVGEAIKLGADASLMDYFAFDRSIPAMGDQNYSPLEWYATPQEYAQKQKARQAAEERENQVKELPGRAAIIKAQAISQKAQAGQNIGGTLSGTPQGGMPMMPGQQQPGGSPFGQPGQPGRSMKTTVTSQEGRRFTVEDLAEDYRYVFASDAAGRVLLDLAPLCFAGTTTYHADPRMHAFQEGARAVWLHINKFLGFTPEQVAMMYRGIPILATAKGTPE